jgi:hypothetical protein
MKKHAVSSREGFKKPTPHVMAVINYKMGNLGLQISTLTNRLLSAK